MSEPLAWLNGRFVPVSEARISVFDMGVVHGVSVTEMLRTFAGRPFRLEDHLDRLERSLQAIGIEIEPTRGELTEIIGELVERNHRLLPEGGDLGVVAFATAGPNPTYVATDRSTSVSLVLAQSNDGKGDACPTDNSQRAIHGSEVSGSRSCGAPADSAGSTVCVHTFHLPFERWADKFETGQHLVFPSARQIPRETIDPAIKHRSRLHWHLADRLAKQIDPAASALLLDQEGLVTETATANFFAVIDGAIVTPPRSKVLSGVSRQVVFELAEKLGIDCREDDLQADAVYSAGEAFTSSTPCCLLPVTRIDGRPIGDDRPGRVFRRLIAAWSDLVGVDIIGQMRTAG